MIKCFMHKLIEPYTAVGQFDLTAIGPDSIKTSRNPASLNLLLITFMYIIIVWNVPNSRTQPLYLEGSLHFISAALVKIDWSKTHTIPLYFNDSFIFNALFITSMMVDYYVAGASKHGR